MKKLKRAKKYEPIARLIIGVVHDKYFVLARLSMTRLYDFVGITYFSIDILKDMVAYWHAWVSKLLCQHYNIALNHIKSPNVHDIKKRIWYDMLNNTPHQKFYFYHLPTWGRVGVKLGMLIRLQRIYNFWLFHAILLSILDVL